MGKQGFYRNRQIAYDWLKATFPAIFGRDTPLKLGIHRDILVFEDENKPANVHIRHAIAMHVSRSAYLARMKVGVERIDLLSRDFKVRQSLNSSNYIQAVLG